jgi:hypothetical protein
MNLELAPVRVGELPEGVLVAIDSSFTRMGVLTPGWPETRRPVFAAADD